jgi:signal transduction histidine kinase
VTLPLYFRNQQLGFLLLTADARGLAFGETLREQISSALAALFLREDLRGALEEAEEANQLKSRFLATVSHELRTPLSLITGTIEMMMRDEGIAALPAAHMEDLANIGSSAQHLSRLIGDVLDLASSQAGELRLVLEPLRIEEVLRDVARLAEPLARDKGLRWRAEVPPALPRVRGDRTRLRQVALNLVSNAIKFTESEGAAAEACRTR